MKDKPHLKRERLFMFKQNKDIFTQKTIEVNAKREKLKRQVNTLGRIAVKSAGLQLKQGHTYVTAGTVGLVQGLKYGGDFKRGIKAGIVSVGVLATVNAVANVAEKWDYIKNS